MVCLSSPPFSSPPAAASGRFCPILARASPAMSGCGVQGGNRGLTWRVLCGWSEVSHQIEYETLSGKNTQTLHNRLLSGSAGPRRANQKSALLHRPAWWHWWKRWHPPEDEEPEPWRTRRAHKWGSISNAPHDNTSPRGREQENMCF